MSTIALMSDLHLEFLSPYDQERHIEERIAPLEDTADILVLAGDIANVADGSLERALTRICHIGMPVVYVAGNHEYYNSNVLAVTQKLTKLNAQLDNFTWLNSNLAIVEGLRFVGGTLWFPVPSNEVLELRKHVNDFHLIGEIEPWVYEEHRRCAAVLQALASTADVVVTHHVPTTACAAPRFGTALNHFFIHDMTAFIEKVQPPLWLFGHSHDQWDVRIGATRLVASPLGYPHEQGDSQRGHYIEKRLVEVEPR